MLYDNYPLIEYNNNLLTNILIRFNLKNDYSLISDFYKIKESDTPESLSFDKYENTKYSWCILTLNNMFNKYIDWPMKTNILSDLTNSVYNYSCVFIPESEITFIFSSVYKIKYNQNYYIIKSTNRDLNVLNLQNKITKSNLKINDVVDLYDKNNIKIKTVGIGRVVYDAAYSLNHFQDSSKLILDNRSNNYINTYINQTISQNNQNLIRTNFDTEYDKNENKRNIILLKKEYISIYENDIKTLINNI